MNTVQGDIVILAERRVQDFEKRNSFAVWHMKKFDVGFRYISGCIAVLL
jgi:hypothetical protein